MNKKRVINLLIILVLIINVSLVLINYLVLDKRLGKQIVATLPSENQRKNEVFQKKTKVPFESVYELINLKDQWMVLKGQKTTTMLHRNSFINIYKQQGESFKEASLSDLKVGQKIKIETKDYPEKGIVIYILPSTSDSPR